MLGIPCLFAAVAALSTSAVSASNYTVSLNYTTLTPAGSGSTSSGTYYVYRNIRYAAPPVGDLRWAAPQDPYQETSVNNGTWSTSGTSSCVDDEDCLFLDVFVPESALSGSEKLPVLFWNYGGGWVGGSKNEETPEGLFELSKNGFIFVAYNYRLDIFGVLNGPTLQRSGGVSNVAVYDARKALEWINTYISSFGGDPDQVTNWGFSAGGSQVLVSLAAFGGHDWTPLQKRAVINSPGWVPGAGHAQAEQYLQNVTELVSCGNASDTIACLRNVSFTELLEAADNITSTYGYQMQPRADGVVLPDTAEYLLGIGQHHRNVDVLLGHSAHEFNLNEGAQDSVTTDDGYRAQLRVIFPAISDWAIDQIAAAFPESDYSSQGYRFADTRQIYDIVGKLLPTTNAYDNKTYNYINYLNGATHGSDQVYWWYGQNQTAYSDSTYTKASTASDFSSEDIAIATQMQVWLLNFVLSGDPNAGTVNASVGDLDQTISTWPTYGSDDQVVEFSTLGFNITGDELDEPKVVVFNKALWY